MLIPGFEINTAFPSPILSTSLPNPAELNTALKKLFLAWEQDRNRPRSSVPTPVIKVGVYESDFSLFSSEETVIQRLAHYCLNAIGHVVSRMNGYSNEEMGALRIYHHSWYHLTRHGGYTAQHNHPMASWSGVYCVDPGDVVPDKPNNGSLRFLDSRTTAGMYLDPGNSHWTGPFGFGELAYNLQAGQLVLFPSYLMHEVAPYYGERERITVAFNAWLRTAGSSVDEPALKLR
ncbi:MAG TPA: putative 2OG-Fe(II) oxygenase [Gammaproteobacteria bacterium]